MLFVRVSEDSVAVDSCESVFIGEHDVIERVFESIGSSHLQVMLLVELIGRKMKASSMCS